MPDVPEPIASKSQSPATPLEYEPARVLRRRRRVFRSILVLTLVIGGSASFFAYRRFQPILQRNLAARELHESCMSYVIPEGKITYRESRIDWSRIQRGANPTSSPSLFGDRNLLAQDMTMMVVNSSMFSWVRPSFLPTPVRGAGEERFTHVLFLHSRRALGGPARLVHVAINSGHPRADTERANYYGGQRPDTWFIRARVYQPAWLLSEGSQVSETSIRQIGNLPPPAFGISFLAGPIDTEDESHFTILYKLSDQSEPMTIDGWLLADDTIRLELRPTTRPAQ